MATYMLLLYAGDADEETSAARWAELPEWDALTEELRERAVWIANAALHPVESATTVRVRDGAACSRSRSGPAARRCGCSPPTRWPTAPSPCVTP